MTKHKKALWLAVVILLAALIFAVKLEFLWVTGEGGRPVLALPLYGPKNFSLAYTHSVQKTPVLENFKAGPGQVLVLESTVYQSLGVGLPFLPEEGKLTTKDGKFILAGINRQFKELNLRSLPLTEQALIYRGKSYYFSRSFSPGELITIKIRPTSPASALLALLLSR